MIGGYVSGQATRARYRQQIGIRLIISGYALSADCVIAAEYHELSQRARADVAAQSLQCVHLREIEYFLSVHVGILIKSQQTGIPLFNIILLIQISIMSQNNANPQPPASQITPIYLAETIFKAAFIVMAIPNLPYTITIGFLASLCGLLRMLKKPQLNKQYLQKVLLNNHGQNILYIGMGCVGHTNFLFFAPLMLYFFYGLAQFYNIKFPGNTGSPKIKGYVDQIRNNRWYFMQTKSRLEILYFVYLLVTIPIDFGRILKCLLMGQYNLLRYRATAETKHAATNINNFINSKISGIGFLHKIYNKIVDMIYKFATQNPGQ